jgi:hypothetical protein
MRAAIDAKEAYLHVEVTGVFNLGEAKTISLRFLAACVDYGLARALVDHRPLTGQISVIERWDYSDFMARQVHAHATAGRLRAPRLAYLGSELVDPRRFGELVAVNRGLIVRSTTRPEEAFEWIGIPES